MGNSKWVLLGLTVALCGFMVACGDDTSSTGGGAGNGGDGDGDGDGDTSECPEAPDGENLDCPEFVEPIEGCYAQKGECCYRSAHQRPEGATTDTSIGFRLNYSEVTNHPATLGLDAINAAGVTRSEHEEQSLLWRFIGPTGEDGRSISGDGGNEFGQGVYNCDGTYSFYGPGAAPSRDVSSDTDRWDSVVTPATIDTTKTGSERAFVAWADRAGARDFSYSPYVNPMTFELEWELVTMGFDVTDIDVTDPTGEEDYTQCMGSRESGTWQPVGAYHVFAPIPNNQIDLIPAISQTFCQLIAFSIIVAPEDGSPAPTCDSDRCTPGTDGCPWLKLPDSLCPLTTEDQAMWGCHVGDENNEDGVVTNCTAEAPTGVLDTDVDGTPEGQCCDPLGQSTDLPACNSYRLANSYVASAAEITESKASALQENCNVGAGG